MDRDKIEKKAIQEIARYCDAQPEDEVCFETCSPEGEHAFYMLEGFRLALRLLAEEEKKA